MTVLQYYLDLQLFAEGGDGGAPADGSSGGLATAEASSGDFLPKNAPQRAKEIYKKMTAKTAQKVDTAKVDTASTEKTTTATTTEEEAAKETPPPKKLTYKELIESEDYKEDHERYVQKTVRDRMKTHTADMSEANELLSLMGQKYGLDVNSPTFRKELSNALNADDSVYEKYAEEHDVPLSEAKKLVGLQQQLDRAQKEAEARKEQDERNKILSDLRQKGAETKAKYPDFDLDSAMQDPRFMRMTAALGGDTTAAYEAINHSALVANAERRAAQVARDQVANSVRSNLSRPNDGNISSSSNTAPSLPNFREMNKQQIDEWAATQRRLLRRR